MSDYQTLLVTHENGLLTITLNRPDKYNALTRQMADELIAVGKTAARDETIRCLLLTGAGKGFCTGQDLDEAAARPAGFSFRDNLQSGFNRVVAQLRELPKPVVMAINGPCVGAGLGLALAADIRLASEKAFFMPAFIGVALGPDTGASYWLPRLIGVARATKMLFTNERVSAEQAAVWGLINEVVPHDELLFQATALGESLAQGPTLSLGLTKRALNHSLGVSFAEQLDYEAYLQEVAGHSADYQEGRAAFREKRKPNFQGR